MSKIKNSRKNAESVELKFRFSTAKYAKTYEKRWNRFIDDGDVLKGGKMEVVRTGRTIKLICNRPCAIKLLKEL